MSLEEAPAQTSTRSRSRETVSLVIPVSQAADRDVERYNLLFPGSKRQTPKRLQLLDRRDIAEFSCDM
jgi:hypothetical protein